MIYEQFELRGRLPSEIETEILFEIASRRAGGAELLRIDIAGSDDEKADFRLVRAVLGLLKNMKMRSSIQFFAFPDNFESMQTEARFLINKYPELFEQSPELGDHVSYVYIKV